jgi:anti-anti-sigma factor
MARACLGTVDFTHLTDNIRRVAGVDDSEARFLLCGEFDISSKQQLYATLEPYVASQSLTVDLAYVTFIDASTLGVFVLFARRRRELNASRLRIVNVSTYCQRILSLCELADIFDIEGVPAGRGKPAFSVAGSLAATVLP